MTDRATLVVSAFVAAWNRRDRDAIAAALHENVVVQGMPMAATDGRDAAMALLNGFLVAEEIDWQMLHIASTGSIVLTERIDRFRFAGRNWTEVRAAGVFEVGGDGLIHAWRDYFDLAEFTAAIPWSS